MDSDYFRFPELILAFKADVDILATKIAEQLA